jgi:regulation of enolase protein 1 (concanavalin A-like superfamily)
VWGTGDAFTFLNTAWSGDGTITARVNAVDNTSVWAKAGVMIRETDTPGSKHVFLMVTPGKGVNLQYRAATSGTSAMAASIPGAAPGWLRLRRAGNTFTASWSTNGTTFNAVGSITVSMASAVKIGLALTSHNTSTQGSAHFDDVRIVP